MLAAVLKDKSQFRVLDDAELLCVSGGFGDPGYGEFDPGQLGPIQVSSNG